jgi:hypothetical protein
MTGARKLLAAGMIGLAGLGVQASALAQEDGGAPRSVESRARQTNEALLAALMDRRSQILRTEDSAEREGLLKVIDGRIAEVKRQLGQ